MRKSIPLITIAFFLLLAHHILYAAEKLNVVASFYPLSHFAEHVGGRYADVTNIMPPGSEPHEYEPTPRDIKKAYDSRVFLFNGAGLDPWAERIREDLKKKGILVIEMTEHFSLMKTEDGKAKPVFYYGHSGFDPHIWLDPLMARKEVEIIRDAFIRADPRHADRYMQNSAAYINELYKLHNKFESGLTACMTREIIVTHNAFSYLARRYAFRTHPVTGISPEEEPSPRKMTELVELSRKKGIRYIFVETLASSKIAETIARETGAKILVLNPLGGLTKDDTREGKTYISIMEENLHNLRLAMSCT